MKVKVKDIVKVAQALMNITYHEGCAYGEEEAIEIADKIIEETTNEYEKGWQDALRMALKEATSYHTEDGTFRCVQEETLIGLGMSHLGSTMNLEREVEI